VPSPELEAWKVVSTRIESFDKLLLDVRLKILGYSAIAAGVVEVFAEMHGDDPLSGTPVAFLFAFIALAVTAVAVADATYYNQLLVAAIGVALGLENADAGAKVPALHTGVGQLVDKVPWWLYALAYGAPALFLVGLAIRHDPCVGWPSLLLLAFFAGVVVYYLCCANRRLREATTRKTARKASDADEGVR
jgi:hypothetical protein